VKPSYVDAHHLKLRACVLGRARLHVDLPMLARLFQELVSEQAVQLAALGQEVKQQARPPQRKSVRLEAPRLSRIARRWGARSGRNLVAEASQKAARVRRAFLETLHFGSVASLQNRQLAAGTRRVHQLARTRGHGRPAAKGRFAGENGKEGVDGSSPSEGSHESPANASFLSPDSLRFVCSCCLRRHQPSGQRGPHCEEERLGRRSGD
jgi:hypothetical protein